jgi:hypothetical protein
MLTDVARNHILFTNSPIALTEIAKKSCSRVINNLLTKKWSKMAKILILYLNDRFSNYTES